ncbi:phospholipase D [Thecamonas trahens ATCC 50062]|uniref:Mitochondrial cardiolipin hydrolase n=1 Tax=Thecamonas trahens ATCC 50062 TaxID=461836 RepID=A0A0L0DPQ4_THETB|nr:phospholipase D [Thecamonas trahens ATCC 50062]KNC54282.1 phospholipase D [Thecamonas trahens ATCC 50062]|eukprot:XP_013753747.1 phospholipase D [Thecamonas trahens ATCC 50062]
MKRAGWLATAVVLATAVAMAMSMKQSSDPAWDHQEKSYHVQFRPAVVERGSGEAAVFFSPDNSTSFLTELVESADKSIDVGTPGFSSWIGCTYGGGCTVEEQRMNETFPIFAALVNALSAGKSVRILTNDFGATPPAAGRIDPLTFLYLAGAEIRYYTSTTFWHAKYISVDARTPDAATAFSSINFSETSFRKNREAGIRLSGEGVREVLDVAADVFDADWDVALQFSPAHEYTPAELAVIRSKAALRVVVPPPEPFPGSYVATTKTVALDEARVELVMSPDYTYETLKAALDAARNTFVLYIYQVTDYDLCEWLGDFVERDETELYLLVSDAIFAYDDYELARGCYRFLTKRGARVQTTRRHLYSFSHQKYWVVDNTTAWMSSGNWSPSDWPQYSGETLVPYNSSHGTWIQANRDFTLGITDAAVVDAFLDVFDGDYWIGQQWVDDAGP